MISEENLGKHTVCIGEWLLHCCEKLSQTARKRKSLPWAILSEGDLRNGERGTAADSQSRKLREDIFNQKRNQSAF